MTLSAYIQQNVDSPDDLELLAYNCVDCHPFDLYLLQGIDGKQAIAMLTKIQDNPNYQNYKDLFFQVNDPLNVNRSISLKDKKLRSILTPCNYPETADCFVNSQILISKINLISYQLDVNGNLIKTTYGNNSNGSRDEQVKKQILTQDIKSFQLKYLLRDGTRTDDPTEGNLPAKANQIVQVEVAIKLKTDNNNLSQEESSLRLFSTFSARNLKYDLSD